jgi:hypothetical protein
VERTGAGGSSAQRRPPISWTQLELPFGEWAVAPQDCRESLTADPLADAEALLCSYPGHRWWARALREDPTRP